MTCTTRSGRRLFLSFVSIFRVDSSNDESDGSSKQAVVHSSTCRRPLIDEDSCHKKTHPAHSDVRRVSLIGSKMVWMKPFKFL
ncbi:hypothetical protein PsorP6_011437 [Peronosclerospora sorghi]|uniref:Uncharacterized protein n=1 Tax=Peronosclerospora sorghi TaxID=230839 RepID=A0ACC0WNE5_9STRA|nr:hypothetical protein PsorP6_011437 [Peronosclerospora sorghi]